MPASGLGACANTSLRITDRFAPVILPKRHLDSSLYEDPLPFAIFSRMVKGGACSGLT
jgi:hypothetical protein